MRLKKVASMAMAMALVTAPMAAIALGGCSAKDVTLPEHNVTLPAEGLGEGGQAASSEMAAYLFVHFIGEGNADQEQIYFSVSTDGTNWTTLNKKKPVLKSALGEKGVRDPYIMRSSKDGKFYIIATDLSIFHLGEKYGNDKWGKSQTEGSRSIVIWKSDDLVTWSEASLKEVAVGNAGCTWAPEAIYDKDSGRYMVFWASKIADDGYSTHRMYKCYTEDFETFTEPEIYIDEGGISMIDTTIVEDDGWYYRFTKDESGKYNIMERSRSLETGFEKVDTYTINGQPGDELWGYEGPAIYKINGTNDWCLLLDFYTSSKGYFPFVTSDLSKGVFESANDFKFPSDVTFRHGTVLPITQAEYDAIVAEYPEN